LRKIETLIREAEAFLKRSFLQEKRDNRTVALRHICEESVDIAKACVHVSDNDLPIAARVLDRALFERIVFGKWVAESEENADRFTNASLEEGVRQLRKYLDRGVGKIIRTSTGENVTEEFRNSHKFKEILRAPKFEDMAREAGMEDIYTMLYGPMSMLSHGNSFGLPRNRSGSEQHIVLSSITAQLAALIAVCEAWYSRQRTLTREDLRVYFKI
jgi:hypothetical protein